jgi:hypothetical protein
MKNIIFAVLTISTLWFSTEKTFAQCACSPDQSTNTQYKISDIIFVGRVIETKSIARENNESPDITVKFEVKQVWKQDLERFVTVKLRYEKPKVFEQNAEWLVYARKNEDGTFNTAISCCTRTKLLSIVSKDLKTFRKMGEKPKKIIESTDVLTKDAPK